VEHCVHVGVMATQVRCACGQCRCYRVGVGLRVIPCRSRYGCRQAESKTTSHNPYL